MWLLAILLRSLPILAGLLTIWLSCGLRWLTIARWTLLTWSRWDIWWL